MHNNAIKIAPTDPASLLATASKVEITGVVEANVDGPVLVVVAVTLLVASVGALVVCLSVEALVVGAVVVVNGQYVVYEVTTPLMVVVAMET